jgi:hypothetical protein
MKNKKLKNNVYGSFEEFEKAFLPELHNERKIREPIDKSSQGILLAKEFVEEVRAHIRCKA